ncbi:hypothetical protein THF1C08_90103 [Vibrio jasicida]|nr:hypothetical protein THF1C08_90103 [Vibrio jasicida]
MKTLMSMSTASKLLLNTGIARKRAFALNHFADGSRTRIRAVIHRMSAAEAFVWGKIALIKSYQCQHQFRHAFPFASNESFENYALSYQSKQYITQINHFKRNPNFCALSDKNH